MSRRNYYTRAEIDWVINRIKSLDRKYIDVSKDDSYIRSMAGESEGDYNMYLLVNELERMDVVQRMECSQWVDGEGYQKVDGFWLTDKFYREMVGRPVEQDNQIAMFNYNQLR